MARSRVASRQLPCLRSRIRFFELRVMLRTRGLARLYRDRLLFPVAEFCLRSGIRESHVSAAAFTMALASAALFAREPWLGGVAFAVSGWLDTLDGEVSRAERRASRSGAFLDSVLDRYSDFVVLLGILGFYHRVGSTSVSLSATLLLLAFGSFMVSYTQARAEGLDSSCSVGFFERAERVLLLSGAAFVGAWVDFEVSVPGLAFLEYRPVMGLALVILAAGTNYMALRRLFHGYRKMVQEAREP